MANNEQKIKTLLSTAYELAMGSDKFNRKAMLLELKKIIDSCTGFNGLVKSNYLSDFIVPENIPFDYNGDLIRLAALYKEAIELATTPAEAVIFKNIMEDSIYILEIHLNTDKNKKYSFAEALTGRQIANELRSNADAEYLDSAINDSEVEALKNGFLSTLQYTYEHWDSPVSERIYKKIKLISVPKFETVEEFKKYKSSFSYNYQKQIISQLVAYEKRVEYYKKIGRI